MNKQPLITVLMPVYNASQYLRDSINSIINQTYSNFEFIIFNDGSKDNCKEIIESYHDKRIVFFNHESNHGYVHHLNHGLAIAQGKYIARMDADDISLPNRFEKQVDFLERNPEYGLCASNARIIGTNKKLYAHTDNPVEIEFFTNNPIAHPSVLFRYLIIKQNNWLYDKSFMPSEDYELWRLLLTKSRIKIFDEPLINYRIHENQISQRENKIQSQNAISIKIKYLIDNLKNTANLTKQQENLYINLLEGAVRKKTDNILQVHHLLAFLYNNAETFYLKTHVKNSWENYIQNYSIDKFNYRILINALSKPFCSFEKLPFNKKVPFIIKCLLAWKINKK